MFKAITGFFKRRKSLQRQIMDLKDEQIKVLIEEIDCLQGIVGMQIELLEINALNQRCDQFDHERMSATMEPPMLSVTPENFTEIMKNQIPDEEFDMLDELDDRMREDND